MRTKFAVVLAVTLVVVALLVALDRHRQANVEADAAPPGAPDAASTSTPSDAESEGADVAAPIPSDADAAVPPDASYHAIATTCGEARCEGLAGDPWSLEERVDARGEGDCGLAERTRHVRLRFESDAGTGTRDMATLEESCPEGSGVSFPSARVFDLDGDGTPELLLVTERGGPKGIVADEGAIWTFALGSIAPYEPPADAGARRNDGGAAAFDFARIEDVDHDGRPDLLTRGGYDNAPPLFVLHSLPTGDFSSTDGVAQTELAKACIGGGPLQDLFLRSRGDEIEPGVFDTELAKAIVCDRARGRSEAELTSVVRRYCNANDGGFTCDEATLALVKHAPKTMLR